jgi:hypothetical protein
VFRFVNNYPSRVWAMVDFHDQYCEGEPWEKVGWFQMDPGESTVPWIGSAGGQSTYWYYFAHAADGALWTGPFTVVVPHQAFEWCENTADTQSRTVGMRELYVGGAENYTLTLAQA